MRCVPAYMLHPWEPCLARVANYVYRQPPLSSSTTTISMQKATIHAVALLPLRATKGLLVWVNMGIVNLESWQWCYREAWDCVRAPPKVCFISPDFVSLLFWKVYYVWTYFKTFAMPIVKCIAIRAHPCPLLTPRLELQLLCYCTVDWFQVCKCAFVTSKLEKL